MLSGIFEHFWTRKIDSGASVAGASFPMIKRILVLFAAQSIIYLLAGDLPLLVNQGLNACPRPLYW